MYSRVIAPLEVLFEDVYDEEVAAARADAAANPEACDGDANATGAARRVLSYRPNRACQPTRAAQVDGQVG